MDGIVLFDHLNAGAAVFGDLVNVGPFHQAHADIGVTQAVGRAGFAVAVGLEIGAVETVVEQLDVIARKDQVGRCRQFLRRRRRLTAQLAVDAGAGFGPAAFRL